MKNCKKYDDLEVIISKIIDEEYNKYRTNELIKVKDLLNIIKCRIRNSLNGRRI